MMDNLPGRKLPNLREVVKGSVFLHPIMQKRDFFALFGKLEVQIQVPHVPKIH